MQISYEGECQNRAGGLPANSRGRFYDKMGQIVVLIESKVKEVAVEGLGDEEDELLPDEEEECLADEEKRVVYNHFTGVILNSEGLILTVADAVPENCEGVSYRLISDFGFQKVKLVAKDVRKNLAILRPLIERKLNYLKFADVGESITAGMEIFSICHPNDMYFTFDKGHVSYGCDFSEREDKTSQTYLGRIVDDVVDKELYPALAAHYDPHLQIIQIKNFCGAEGTYDGHVFECRGSPGAPIFDCQGKVIGLIAFRHLGYTFGVHFQELKDFVKKSLELDEGKGKKEARGGKEKKQGRGDEGQSERKMKYLETRGTGGKGKQRRG
ncbi:hypothetical protein Vadar_000446 [Vaccinium darrowii]|uniref:Uncharacterized protein n=1 Tax=Vaccinium darrowii TaxID=229202 RepID=A0ACB7YB25_9ERIC|nr:hypothetical protein Vadar_000446 [Vaccinium darrowii]